MSKSSGTLYPEIRVYSPDGTKLCDTYSSDAAEIASCALTSTGTHSILALSHYGTYTGDYYLYLQRLNNPGNPLPIAFGQTLSGSIAAPAEMDAYTFAASAGDKVLVRMTRSSGSLYSEIRVYGSDGTKLCDAHSSETAEIVSCPLTSTGTYSILASSYYGTYTGDYHLSLQRLNNPGNSLPIAFGQTLSGSIATPAEMDTYTFAANAGDRVLARMSKSSGTLYPEIRVYSPDGTKLCDTYSSDAAEIASCALTSTGIYSILALSHYGTYTGDYYLYLQRLNSPGNSLPIAFGQTLSGSIAAPAEMDAYTFAANTGDKVLVRMTRSSGSLYPQIRVYGPDGTKLCEAHSSETAEIVSCTLTSTGTHSILASSYYGTYTGDYYLTATRTNASTATSTGTSTATATPTPTPTTTPTLTATPTRTPTPTTTPVITATPSATPTMTATRAPTSTPGDKRVFLPLIMSNWPQHPAPATPILNGITPPEVNPSYSVSWSEASGATGYVLEQARDAGFAAPAQVCSGPTVSCSIPSVGIATYYFRVKATNAWGSSSWSNVQPVEVRWEREPNDQIPELDSRSGLLFNQTHYGTMSSDRDIDPAFDQGRDYFYFDVDTARTVEFWLRDIPTGSNYDLFVRPDWDIWQIIGRSDSSGNADEYIRLDADELPAGHRYFVQVYNRTRVRSTQPYALTMR